MLTQQDKALDFICNSTFKKIKDMMVHACNPSTREAAAGESEVQSHAWLFSEFTARSTCLKKKKKVYF